METEIKIVIPKDESNNSIVFKKDGEEVTWVDLTSSDKKVVLDALDGALKLLSRCV